MGNYKIFSTKQSSFVSLVLHTQTNNKNISTFYKTKQVKQRFPKLNLIGRVINQVTFAASTFFYLLLHRPRKPILVLTNPPFLVVKARLTASEELEGQIKTVGTSAHLVRDEEMSGVGQDMSV